jgi:hypothetical protein
MSMAIKYAMRKRMAKGGMCAEGCDMDHAHNYADGGDIKGVHKPRNYRVTHEEVPTMHSERHEGESLAGQYAKAGYKEHAKQSHEDVLSEMKSMKGKDRKYMAEGGDVDADKLSEDIDSATWIGNPKRPPSSSYAEGGEVDEGHDLVDAIMLKRKGNSPGAEANRTGPMTDFEDNQFDDLVKDDHLDSEADYTGANSGDHLGNEAMDERDHDLISAIMRSRRKKDRLPNPR